MAAAAAYCQSWGYAEQQQQQQPAPAQVPTVTAAPARRLASHWRKGAPQPAEDWEEMACRLGELAERVPPTACSCYQSAMQYASPCGRALVGRPLVVCKGNACKRVLAGAALPSEQRYRVGATAV